MTQKGKNTSIEKEASTIFYFKKSGNRKEDIMYALIYDEFDIKKREKKIISVHKTRKTAEKALTRRQRRLGKKVWECNTRIVWTDGRVRSGDSITPDLFDTWAPGEVIPEGDRVSDGD
jgi:hypothetical protein